ncbi:exonuclease-like protein [Massariosphaeria phaeospora]|uniref:Exonuclease-like protein n=1 Tax=Massariosphaeria phaeospora TaxID=100035 RepID=A0A7C8M3E7_9PLEO|nr:exonuclease-like protein [Massariosphaeria phaeospora]
MGISGLLPLLKSIHKPCSLKKFAGQTIGVDAYGWLHRGTAACAIELALDKPTTKFVDFAMNRVRMLIHFGITPYIVFDGDYLPSKAGTEKERKGRRKEGKRLGLELLSVGKTSQAHLELQKAVDVTPEMARQLIDELKHNNIQYVVAPYEADSQLAYLEKKGIIDGILSEDSDLLVFGAKCLITKLDKYGECVEINRNHFTACREISLVGWSDADFRRMSMLSGCDYLPSIGSMGLKTAHRMLRKHKTVDRLVKAAQFDGKFKVPPGYLDAFDQAEKTFLYQWVFCPETKQLLNLTPLESGLDISSMPFLGEEVPSHIAFGVARGDLHPHTKLPITVVEKHRPNSKPLIPSRRASSIVQTPDLKKSKPIDSFFKPRRTPLAELDPNSFTPSPSQRALLEEGNRTWVAVTAPSTHQGPPMARTVPPPARRAVSDSITGRRSAPHPSKRQRLCSDSVLGTPDTKKSEVTRSRFFASSGPDPSPSLRTSKPGRRRSAHNFELHSDDSIEDVMAELADLDELASQPKKKIRIFKDDSFPSIKPGSQSTTLSRSTTGPSQDTIGTLTPATSHGSPEPETGKGSIFGEALSSQVEDLRARYSYKSSLDSSSGAPSTPKAHRRSTIQIRAESVNTNAGFVTEQPSTKGPLSKFVKAGRDEDEFGALAWAAMEAEVVVAASSPIGLSPAKHEVEAKGSEDLLVPDSDAESACSPRKPLINLGRFTFSG